MIEIRNLTKTFASGEQRITVADNISIKIKTGEFVSLVGKSGSGKSTLLNMIGGLLKPDSGDIIVDDLAITDLNESGLTKYRAEKMGYIFQAFHLEPMYTVADNIRLGLLPSKLSVKEIKKLTNTSLAKVGLNEKINTKVCKLSGGEKQRVAIARVLAKDADLILADEPCGNLDSQNSEMIMKLLRQANDMKKTVILVTHNEADARLTDRIIRLSDGRIVSDEYF